MTPETVALKPQPRVKPSLVKVGSRDISPDGRWHLDLAADYVKEHGLERHIPVGELARVFYGGNLPTNRERIRRRLSGLFHTLIRRGYLMVAEYAARKIVSVKLFNEKSEQDQRSIKRKLEQMHSRKLLTAELFERALQLVPLSEPAC